MFKRKLSALGYPGVNLLNISDDRQFKNAIIWLEDQKIRRYKIEEREELRNSTGEAWNNVYRQYLQDLDCPFADGARAEIFDWLLGLGVHFEFAEKADAYTLCKENVEVPAGMKANPLDNLDFESNDFKSGVNTIASILKVPKHPDHLVTLEAICSLVKERLDPETLKDPARFCTQGTPFPFEDSDLGMDLKDPKLNHALKILRYLFIHDLRDLQTKVNEAIVAVQSLTADPKTDTKLGKVGF